MKNFKSYGFWTALSGAVVVLINAIGKCFGFSIEEEIVSNIIMAVAGVLVVFGVVAMPKKDDAHKNDKQEVAEPEDKQDNNSKEEMPKQENIAEEDKD